MHYLLVGFSFFFLSVLTAQPAFLAKIKEPTPLTYKELHGNANMEEKVPSPAQVDTPVELSKENIFLWAADPKSGTPYVFQDPANRSILTGFEKDIIEEIARYMGKKAVFTSNTWEVLIPGLKRHMYDAIINGIEITQGRMDVVNFSIPYYKAYLQLVVGKDNTMIKSLKDCGGKVVGVLRNSKAAEPLYHMGDVDIRSYSDEVNGFIDVANNRIDAFLIDYPVALYYVGANPQLKLIGDPVGSVDYGIVVRKEDAEFLRQINAAIEHMISSGKLRQILDNWNLWNDMMKVYTNDFSPSQQVPAAYEAYLKATQSAGSFKATLKKYIGFLPSLGKGAVVTIEISVVSMILAMVLGLVLAVVRIYGPRPLSILSNIYVECIRGTPLLIQLYFIFYGLPTIGIKFNPFIAGVVALGFNYAAFEAENYRAGILAIHSGQMEAARALGMTQWQGLRYVVIPQAFRVMLPPVTNDFIALLKDSALVSVVSIVDLTHAYNLLATNYFNYFELGIIVAIIYLILGLPFVQLTRWAERQLAVEKKRNY